MHSLRWNISGRHCSATRKHVIFLSLSQFGSLMSTAVSLFANCKKWGMWRNQSHLIAVLWRGVRNCSVIDQHPSMLACMSCPIWIVTARNGNISDVTISGTGEGPLSWVPNADGTLSNIVHQQNGNSCKIQHTKTIHRHQDLVGMRWHKIVFLASPPVFTLHSMWDSSCIISGSVTVFTMLHGYHGCPSLSEA
jgi:hypothetical protein